MRLALVFLATVSAFGCSNVTPPPTSTEVVDRTPRFVRVQEDVDAIQSGMDRARASYRAGL